MQAFLVLGLSNAVMATALAILACLAGVFFRRPALRHTLWLLVLLKLVTPPLLTMPLEIASQPTPAKPSERGQEISLGTPLLDEPSTPAFSLSAGQLWEQQESELRAELADLKLEHGAVKSLATAPQGWLDAFVTIDRFWIYVSVASIWALGSVLWLTTAALRICSFQRLLGLGRLAPEHIQEQAQGIATRIGLTNCPQVWLIPGRVSPLLWALGGRARLVLPADLLGRLQDQQLDTLLAHELAHARRHDHWVRWLELTATVLYWWHPVVWWARHALHQAEEECCDAWVVWTLPAAAKAYARALLQTVDFLDVRPALPPVASGIGHVNFLKRRVQMIVNSRFCPNLPWPVSLAAIVAGCLVLPIAPQRLAAGLVADDDKPSPRSAQEAKLKALERRMSSIEEKLQQLIDQRRPEASEQVDRARQETERFVHDAERRVHQAEEHARQLAQEAQRKAHEEIERAHQMVHQQMEQAHKAMAEAQARVRTVEKQGHEGDLRPPSSDLRPPSGDDHTPKEIRKHLMIQVDPEIKQDGKNQHKQRIIINDKELDLGNLKDLEKQIDEAVHKAVNPERLEKIQVQIQEAVANGMDEAKIKKLERQIEENVHRAVNPEKLHALAKQIEDTVNRSVQSVGPRGPQPPRPSAIVMDQEKPLPPPPPVNRSADSARASKSTTRQRADLDQRLDKLEAKMDRLLEALERNQKKGG
jgi:beta-lactamase regulating signal transducer with metallopeptidase domain